MPFAISQPPHTLLVPRAFRGRSTEMPPPVCKVGKRPGWSLAATSVTGLPTSPLFYVTDRTTSVQYLVDTGAEVSVIPLSRSDQPRQPEHLTLEAVNNTLIKTYGKRSLTLNLGLRRTFQWVFILSNVEHPILGADYLRHFGLLVDMRHHRLSDVVIHLHIQGITCNTKSPSLSLLPRRRTSIHALQRFW